ncbi:hypothetical protein EsVE80_01970 [Enterococcus saigonensis]|uniref:TPM domain-containing protein n=1 Tax=Enterococcus saigonensis TaxID=1805431 RepID=A0A679ILJ6_9ENTE|nr:TPM domain-containing protein [Enterococcus saigonensis]BCA84674.1 hypothetical protein EsVE80_01970 [Enterococcus saigonensis]
MNKQRPASSTIQTDQKIRDFYQIVVKRNRILRMILFVIVLLFGVGLVGSILDDHTFVEKKLHYDTQLQELQIQREDILSGKIQPSQKSFDEVLKDNMDQLGDYPSQADNYQVAIKDSNSKITINKNNIFVSDNAKIINAATKKKIYNLNKQLAASTDGAQLEVVTVNALPSGEDIESYANKIFNQLGIGDKTQNNGVLYLIALEDRKFRLEVGYGLEGLIPDATAEDIINNDDVVDLFKDENYSKAISQVVEEVFSLMNTKTALVDSQIAQVTAQKRNLNLFYWGLRVFFVGMMLIAIIVIISLSRGRRYLKEIYQKYQVTSKQLPQMFTDEKSANTTLKQTELYYVMLSGLFLAATVNGVKKAIIQGRLLKQPNAKKMGMGRVLIGDTLYGGYGQVLTYSYLSSNYNSANHNSSSGGSGGSWGSFGGGSSGGGGASGGW